MVNKEQVKRMTRSYYRKCKKNKETRNCIDKDTHDECHKKLEEKNEI
jgi:hypothetical protein